MKEKIEFWQRVVMELDYQQKSRKWLASEAEIELSSINSGISRKSTPSAETALKIANALKISPDLLVFGE